MYCIQIQLWYSGTVLYTYIDDIIVFISVTCERIEMSVDERFVVVVNMLTLCVSTTIVYMMV